MAHFGSQWLTFCTFLRKILINGTLHIGNLPVEPPARFGTFFCSAARRRSTFLASSACGKLRDNPAVGQHLADILIVLDLLLADVKFGLQVIFADVEVGR